MEHELVELGPGVFAWLALAPTLDAPNAGVVIAADGLTVIDSLTTPHQAKPLAAALAAMTELPVRRVVYTGSHIGQVGGSSAFPLAAIYGSGQTSAHLDQPSDPAVLAQLHPTHGAAFADLVTRPVSHTVTEAAHLCPASIAVPVGGQQFENLVVQVPGANVVFCGAIATFGVTPAGFDSDFPRWVETLETLKSWGELFVPAYGPIGGIEEIETLQHYFEACLAAKGDESQLGDGVWRSWSNPEFHAVNVQRAAQMAAGDPNPPPALLAMLGR